MAETYYSLINVAPTASRDDILDVLRQENMKWSRRANNAPKAAARHEAEQRVELLAQIKAVLTDPASRAQYDALMGIGAPPPRPVDLGWPPDLVNPPPNPDPWPDPDPPKIREAHHDGGLEGLLRWLLTPWWWRWWRRRSGGGSKTSRIKHPVWTVGLLILALSSFGSAGLLGSTDNSNSNNPVAGAIVGIVAIVIAARVSGVWRRR